MGTAIVTGAAGFIGRWLVRELAQNCDNVIAVVRPGGHPEWLDNRAGVKVIECGLHEYGRLPALAGPQKTVRVLPSCMGRHCRAFPF